MHALRRFLEDGLHHRGWTQSRLARESGVSKQVIHGIVADTRDRLDRLPQDKTIDGIARAFDVDRGVLLSVIAQAMGLPVSDPVVVYDARGVADSDLVRELARRLERTAGTSTVVPLPTSSSAVDERAWAARAGRPEHGPDVSEPGEGVPGAAGPGRPGLSGDA